MPDYCGSVCVICDKKFTNEDEIVVCPECGTPYHRECYLAAGKCVADGLHLAHESWGSLNTQPEEEGCACRQCGHINPHGNMICEGCGKYVADPETEENKQEIDMASVMERAGFKRSDVDEEFDGVKSTELSSFIGRNAQYYIFRFKLMKEMHIKTSINMSAFLFRGLYFGHRKMYPQAILSIVIDTLLSIPSAIVLMTSEDYYASYFAEKLGAFNMLRSFSETGLFNGIMTVASMLSWAVMIVFGICANYWYYRFCIKQIEKCHDESNTDVSASIKRSGGTSLIGLVNAASGYIAATFLVVIILSLL